MSATKDPSTDLGKLKAFYVVHLPADDRNIDKIIADQLNLMGYKATAGESSSTPANVDAVVTYQDRWMWDITMYMIELNIQVRDPQTNFVLASGRSMRPSLERKSPPDMAQEVLQSIFHQS
jgi:hypothetical protein